MSSGLVQPLQTVKRMKSSEASRAGVSESPVDALPDELLVRIFSLVADGATLLDSLQLVCKRWRRVARDPASWAGVELVVGNEVATETRVLLHAPAAKSLVIRDRPEGVPLAGSSWYGPEAGRRVRHALRRSRALVQSFSVLDDWDLYREWSAETGDDYMTSSVSCFLARNAEPDGFLRELRLKIPGCRGSTLLKAIRPLRRLEQLQLVVSPALRYDGELAGARLPKLRVLRVHSMAPHNVKRSTLPEGIIADLALSATGLQVLDVDLPCRKDLQTCIALRGLEQVALNFYEGASGFAPPMREDLEEGVLEACLLLRQVESAALRSAVIWVSRGDHLRYTHWAWAKCSKVVRENPLPLSQVQVELRMNVEGERCGECGAAYKDCSGTDWDEIYFEWEPEPDCSCDECADSDSDMNA